MIEPFMWTFALMLSDQLLSHNEIRFSLPMPMEFSMECNVNIENACNQPMGNVGLKCYRFLVHVTPNVTNANIHFIVMLNGGGSASNGTMLFVRFFFCVHNIFGRLRLRVPVPSFVGN